MKPFQDNIRKIFFSDGLLVAAILGIFLLTNRYIFGWDDQHLEVPLLKHLIDPALYRGDYYVESLKENFTTFLYPLLSRFLKVDQVEPAYLILFLAFRFIFFFWVFKFWKFLAGGSRAAAFFATLALFMISRPEEFIKRTFSHQAFSYAFVFAGIYYFYRERYLIASLIFGFAANFHALFALFPELYLLAYLLFFQKERKWSLFLKSWLAFTLAALPFLVWTVTRAVKLRLHADPHLYDNWMELYLLSCPQNFLFGTTPLKDVLGNLQLLLSGLNEYIFMATLYCFHLAANEDLRRDFKTHAMAIMVMLSLCATFFFSYVIPSHFVLDLNLVRNEQFIRFILSGYAVLIVWKNLSGPAWKMLLLSVVLALSGGKELSDVAIVSILGLVVLSAEAISRPQERFRVSRWILAGIFLTLVLIYHQILWASLVKHAQTITTALKTGFWPGLTSLLTTPKIAKGYWTVILFAILTAALLALNSRPAVRTVLSRLFVIIPFTIALVFYCVLHYNFVQISTHGSGFWQLQRNWEDMQRYVRDHTPKDALIMAPNDMEMGGFRIRSERRLLTDYRDCGIVGFDLGATVEWQRRMKDIDAFKVIIKEPFTNALMNGIVKYKADYIVFMRYAAPPDNALLAKLYENEVFSLFRVQRNR